VAAVSLRPLAEGHRQSPSFPAYLFWLPFQDVTAAHTTIASVGSIICGVPVCAPDVRYRTVTTNMCLGDLFVGCYNHGTHTLVHHLLPPGCTRDRYTRQGARRLDLCFADTWSSNRIRPLTQACRAMAVAAPAVSS